MGSHRQHRAIFPLLLAVVALLQPGSASIFSKELYGQGDADVQPLYEAWSNAYRATRDDVTVVYDVQAAKQALDNILSGQNDFINLNAAVDASDPDSFEQYGSMFQVPIAAQGLAFTYNLPALNASTDPVLVLDLKALADIFMGNITVWSDPYLATLNPELALASKLPTLNITMAFIAGDGLDLSEPLKRALLPYNDALGPAIDAADGDFSGLPPTLNGHAHAIADQAERLNFVRATAGALTYLGSADALRANLVCASLVNKANNTIALSTKSVAAAVADFAQEVNAGAVVDIADAPGAESYPLAYISFISIPSNLTTPDCSLLTDLLTFFSWTQTNQRALDILTELEYNSFGDGGRKHLIDTLAEVECNGEQAFDLAILIGVGAPLAEFAIWATDYANDDDDDKPHYYFADTEDIVQETVLEQVDYGITTVGLNATAAPDLTILPAAAIPVVPAYNLPTLSGVDQPLVLNLSVIAEIYLGSVTRWNDPKIVELNADLLAAQPTALPDQEIMVLVLSNPSDITELFTRALSMAVDGWDDAVRFPVQDLANRTTNVTAVDLAQKLKTTLYSFTFWTPFQVIATRAANMASLVNADNYVVAVSRDTVTAALGDDYVVNSSSETAFLPHLFAPGEHSWPLVAWASFLLNAEQANCNKLRGLVEFVYWTHTSETADVDLSRAYGVSANKIEATKTYIFSQLEALKCDGQFVVPFQHCLINGTVCSNEGLCSDDLGTCICESGHSGVHCETIIITSSSSSNDLAVGLGVGLAVGFLGLLVLLLLAVVVVVLARRGKDERDDWEIDLDHEIELGTVLGTGGFGEVYRATWKGTEVAVKKMVLASSERATKEMEKNFRDEVRVMTALRHPNVVLFMAACTKAPNMCIVMEYMGLGSLFELLHNELVPEIPTELRYKMAYQAAKGMHFLHSSGIVHRDLKSLNLLLDNKWNVKVSDFGLTKFKEDLKKTGAAQQQAQGSIHWTAPEILNEVDAVDHILADVYSFGIVLWEMLTREQPYYGMSPAAVAVAVIRDSLRPEIPEDADQTDFGNLITTCWHQDPSIRPTFLEIMTRLSSMLGDSSGMGSKTSTNSSSSSSGKADWSLPLTSMATGTTASQASSSRSSSSSDQLNNPPGASAGQRPPSGDDVTIVFTDIARAASLWEFDPRAMRDATLLHNALLRSLLKEHKGYEASFVRDRNSGEGSFCMAFHNVRDALAWCADAQQRLLLVDWPPTLIDHPGAAEEWGHTDDRVVFKGLRVRMGVNAGAARAVKDAMTRRVEYVGPTVNAAARITALTHGGQVLLAQSAYDKLAAGGLEEHWRNSFTCMGRFEVPDQASGARLYEFKVEGLEARFFGGVASELNNRRSEPSEDGEEQEECAESNSDSAGSGRLSQPHGDTIRRNEAVQSVVGEGMMFKEDNFLTSANLCRWIIDFKEIQLGKQVGMGSYGVVFRGCWKGVDVAVKRFIKQKLDERSMLEFRAEMAFLSELHHPNIVLFIGSCVKAPNLCIVTEFVKQGSLSELLQNTGGVKLEWLRRMRMLRSAALGINYLHSLRPVIVHRDLKSSNLLVDENWNVKVADFGFARIKEENATMTRCGTPCWTAPEVIRGESYSEKADVYSFAIIMWEVVTRKQPFAGLNFMGVSLDVLEGKRPQVPADCPRDVAKLMAKCWHDKPAKRPSMEDVVTFFDRLLEDASPGDAERGDP